MAKLSVVFFVVGLVSIVVGIVAKLFVGIMFEIKPISYVVFGNTCFLLAILTKIWKR